MNGSVASNVVQMNAYGTEREMINNGSAAQIVHAAQIPQASSNAQQMASQGARNS